MENDLEFENEEDLVSESNATTDIKHHQLKPHRLGIATLKQGTGLEKVLDEKRGETCYRLFLFGKSSFLHARW